MSCVFEVSPFDGGWSVKLCDTGEVLFFDTGGQAEREARRLAAAYPGRARVRVFDLRRQLAGEWAPLAVAEARPRLST
ncbi:hypothetical protein [Caulobacter sp.]|uniref:hypothetical protein n=1 Tax=Caulobacter sp. TaxID=78 RepID=UPI001B048AE3|nr:hypothetical protein [Caulobacter sp.]MBO9544604.1 hypothetical protein [Caulobacter sp.]